MPEVTWLQITFTPEEIKEKKHAKFIQDFMSCKESAADSTRFALFFRTDENEGRAYFFPGIFDDLCGSLAGKYPVIEQIQKPVSRPINIEIGSFEDHKFWFEK